MFLQANAELGQIWAVGQKMWQRDFPGMYETLKKDWSDSYKDIMAAVLGKYGFTPNNQHKYTMLEFLSCL